MEPLIHFIVPFAALTILGVQLKRALPISLVAVLPDLDVFFHVHRSFSHSLIVLLALSAPIMLLVWRTGLRKYAALGLLAALSHPVMDLGYYTPLFWPLYGQSFMVLVDSAVRIASSPAIHLSVKVLTAPTVFSYFKTLDAPLFTGEGLMVFAVLSAAAVLKALADKR